LYVSDEVRATEGFKYLTVTCREFDDFDSEVELDLNAFHLRVSGKGNLTELRDWAGKVIVACGQALDSFEEKQVGTDSSV
jgi:hypothetical protein